MQPSDYLQTMSQHNVRPLEYMRNRNLTSTRARYLSVIPSSVAPSMPLSWNLEITSALGGRMMSLSQEVTCLVPQVRTAFHLEGESGTFTSGDTGTSSRGRLAPCQPLAPAVPVGGERGGGASVRADSGLEMP